MKWGLTLLLPLCVLFTGCHPIRNEKNSSKVFKANFPFDPTTLDPRKGMDGVASTVHFMLYEGLTRMTPKSTHELGAADDIVISDDRLIYTFHLRDSSWSNGDPVTSNDFAYAWETMLEPRFPCPNANLLYPIKNAEKVKRGDLPMSELGIRIIDEKTLEVTLERPTPYFLDLTSFCVLFPVPNNVVKRNPKWADDAGPDLVVNGPFKLDSWKKTDELTFSRNSSFWESEKVKLDQVLLYILDNPMTTLNMYQSGSIDFLGGIMTNIPPDWIPQLQESGELQVHPLGATTFFTFNVDRFPFTNKHIRKALSFAIDRSDIIENITQAGELVATGCIAPILKGGKNIPFYEDANTDAALNELEIGLKELGIKKDELDNLTLSYFSNEVHRRVACALKEKWRETLGVNIRLVETDFKVFVDKLSKRDYDIGQIMWIVQYNDQMNVLDRFKLKSNPKNYPGWENKEYIKLLESSSFAKTDVERAEILEQAEALITEEMPFGCLFHWNTLYLQKEYVDGLFISPVGSIHLNETSVQE